MNRVARARELYREDGAYALLRKSLRYGVNNYLSPRYYRLKSSVVGSQLVEIDGVLLDVDDAVFSPTMKNRIRRKVYEDTERSLIGAHVHSDRPVVDLGAGIGYTACVADRETDDSTPVVAVEANESLIPVIETTRSLNRCDFDVLHAAYDPDDDPVEFQVSDDFWASSGYRRENGDRDTVTVPGCSVGQIRDAFSIERPTQLVVDIEGSEHDLITNERDTLRDDVSLLIFEYHSFTEEPVSYYRDVLTDIGFEFVECRTGVYVFRNTAV